MIAKGLQVNNSNFPICDTNGIPCPLIKNAAWSNVKMNNLVYVVSEFKSSISQSKTSAPDINFKKRGGIIIRHCSGVIPVSRAHGAAYHFRKRLSLRHMLLNLLVSIDLKKHKS